MPASVDVTGRTFGRLTALFPTPGSRSKPRLWMCQCVCGNQVYVDSRRLTTGHTKSCGCLRDDTTTARNTTHGKSLTIEHICWKHLVQRCTNPKNRAYKNYGGRGVMICRRWRESFTDFLADMGQRPANCTSIDRIKNEGHYEPGNCRWTTRDVQNNNTRVNHRITWKGKTQSVALWARELGLHYRTLQTRLANKWTVAEALTTPTRRHN